MRRALHLGTALVLMLALTIGARSFILRDRHRRLNTELLASMYASDLKKLKAAVRGGADARLRDGTGQTTVMAVLWAADDPDLVRELLARRVDPNARDFGTWTA